MFRGFLLSLSSIICTLPIWNQAFFDDHHESSWMTYVTQELHRIELNPITWELIKIEENFYNRDVKTRKNYIISFNQLLSSIIIDIIIKTSEMNFRKLTLMRTSCYWSIDNTLRRNVIHCVPRMRQFPRFKFTRVWTLFDHLLNYDYFVLRNILRKNKVCFEELLIDDMCKSVKRYINEHYNL